MPNLSWKGFLDLRCWLFWDILSRDLSQLHSHFIISCQFEVADVPVECQKCFPLWWCIWGSLYGATSGTCKLLYDEVYMRKFLVNLKWEFIVCKIKKVIYKLKQNPRVWFVIFSTIIVGAGFQRYHYDHSLFVRRTTSGIVLLAICGWYSINWKVIKESWLRQ